MTSAPGGILAWAATVRILSPSTMTTALAMTLWPSQSLLNRMALVAAAAGRAMFSRDARRKIPKGRIDVLWLQDTLRIGEGTRASIQQPRDRVRIVRHQDGPIPEIGRDPLAARRFQLARVVLVNVIRVLEYMPGQHRHHIVIRPHGARRAQLPDSGERCGRGGFASDSTLSDHRFCIRNLLLRDLLDQAVRIFQNPQRLRPRDGIANLDGRR